MYSVILLSLLATAVAPPSATAELAAFAPSEHAVSVLVFLSTDCPIANASAPELNRIASDFAKEDVVFFRVYADPELDSSEIIGHGEAFDYAFPGIHDSEQILLRHAGATRVPEVAVFDRAETLVYRGRINNAFADFGKRRRHVTEHDLRDAIQAVLDGNEIANPRVPALGCFISLIETEDSAAPRAEEEVHEADLSTN